MSPLAISLTITAILAVFGGLTKWIVGELRENRNATEVQFDSQNKKIEANFRSLSNESEQNFRALTNTTNRIEVQTTKTNGRVDAHDGRLNDISGEVKILREKMDTRATRAATRRK